MNLVFIALALIVDIGLVYQLVFTVLASDRNMLMAAMGIGFVGAAFGVVTGGIGRLVARRVHSRGSRRLLGIVVTGLAAILPVALSWVFWLLRRDLGSNLHLEIASLAVAMTPGSALAAGVIFFVRGKKSPDVGRQDDQAEG